MNTSECCLTMKMAVFWLLRISDELAASIILVVTQAASTCAMRYVKFQSVCQFFTCMFLN